MCVWDTRSSVYISYRQSISLESIAATWIEIIVTTSTDRASVSFPSLEGWSNVSISISAVNYNCYVLDTNIWNKSHVAFHIQEVKMYSEIALEK